MADELSAEQSENLTRALELAKELLALPSVSKTQSRFEAEVALVVTSDGLDQATEIIEKRTGAPAKAAQAPRRVQPAPASPPPPPYTCKLFAAIKCNM